MKQVFIQITLPNLMDATLGIKGVTHSKMKHNFEDEKS